MVRDEGGNCVIEAVSDKKIISFSLFHSLDYDTSFTIYIKTVFYLLSRVYERIITVRQSFSYTTFKHVCLFVIRYKYREKNIRLTSNDTLAENLSIIKPLCFSL